MFSKRNKTIITLTATISIVIALSGFFSLREQKCNDKVESLKFEYLNKKLVNIQYENMLLEGDCLKNPTESCTKILQEPHNNNEIDAENISKQIKNNVCKYYTVPLTILHVVEVLIATAILIFVWP